MKSDGLIAGILRFWAGFLGSVLLGYGEYRADVFIPTERPFQCVTIGAVAAAILAAVRAGRLNHATMFVAAVVLLQWSFNFHLGWVPATVATVTGLFVAGGLLLASIVFDQLAAEGLRFGKFVVFSLMSGGLYFAVSPVAGWGGHLARQAFDGLMNNLFLGFVIGSGVGLGVELVEFVPGLRGASGPAARSS